MTGRAEVVAAGDATLIVRFEETIDEGVNARAVALGDTVAALELPGVLDVVPTFRSVAVSFDPIHTNRDELAQRLHDLALSVPSVLSTSAPAPIRVPVHYGGAFGPDLGDVARFAGLSEDGVVARHAGVVYRVYMLGFMPGFAYMGVVDDRIAAPRRATPRVSVLPGSVGIAGRQTAIYPMATPGGWQIIGRASIAPFDLAREPACLFKAGDTVQFVPADPA